MWQGSAERTPRVGNYGSAVSANTKGSGIAQVKHTRQTEQDIQTQGQKDENTNPAHKDLPTQVETEDVTVGF